MCNISSPDLYGKIDIDEGFKNWSAIENVNPVCLKKYSNMRKYK